MMLYIHVPYCKGKCIYCDFYSGGMLNPEEYAEAVCRELKEREGEIGGRLDSIYIGGGTPSLMPPECMRKLADGINSILDQRGIGRREPDFEFTIEVNPEDVTEENAKEWAAIGINRISMGVQSLNDNELTFLKRRHNADKAIDSMRILKRYFNNISLDIIYGIPGQTEESLKETLDRIIELKPQHISAYALTYEKNTPLYLFEKQGKIEPATEDGYLKMGELISTQLSDNGYERYEISNFSIPGYHSRHNSGYWEGKPYLGLGPSASSYDGKRTRKTNRADIKGYLSRQKGEKFYDEEILTEGEMREERIFLALRTAKGIDIEDYHKKFGEKERVKLLEKAGKWIKGGEIIHDGRYLRLSSEGMWVSDYIICDLI